MWGGVLNFAVESLFFDLSNLPIMQKCQIQIQILVFEEKSNPSHA